VAEHAEGEGDGAGEGEAEQDGDGAEGNDEVLADDGAGLAAESISGEEVFEAIVHEDDVGLLEGGIGSAGAHGDAHVGGGEAWGIVDSVADHGDGLAGLHQVLDGADFIFGAEFGADVIEVE